MPRRRRRGKPGKGARDLYEKRLKEKRLAEERDKLRAREVNKEWVHVWQGGAPQ